MEESASHEEKAIRVLNFVWGTRLVICFLFLFPVSYGLITTTYNSDFNYTKILIPFIIFLIAEITTIISFFRKKQWTKFPLHVFATLSVINFPFGTILSILHFAYYRKISFFLSK